MTISCFLVFFIRKTAENWLSAVFSRIVRKPFIRFQFRPQIRNQRAKTYQNHYMPFLGYFWPWKLLHCVIYGWSITMVTVTAQFTHMIYEWSLKKVTNLNLEGVVILELARPQLKMCRVVLETTHSFGFCIYFQFQKLP